MRPALTALTILAAAGLCLAAQQAQAQTPGTYSGTADDGTNVNFTVSDDGSGNLSLSAFGLGLSDTCHPGSFTLNTGWGLGASDPISHGKVTYTTEFNYLYVDASIKFTGSTATGTITNSSPTFVPFSGTKPSKAAFCSSPKQNFTASLSPGAASLPRLRPGTAMLIQMQKAR